MSSGADFETVEELLRNAEFEDCRELWYSSNYVYLVRMADAGDQPVGAVYKPGAGERPLWDFPPGLFWREAVAYELAKLLGWNFIPPTVVRDGPHGAGSLQLYVAHDPEEHFFVQRENEALVPQLQRIALFDLIANNADRKGGHCLLDDNGNIWGIDHGLCFHEDYKLRTVIWDWADMAVPDALLGDVSRALALIEEGSETAARVLEPLTRAERRALRARMKRVLEHRRLPLPGPRRSYPWPLV